MEDEFFIVVRKQTGKKTEDIDITPKMNLTQVKQVMRVITKAMDVVAAHEKHFSESKSVDSSIYR